ncbi:putative multi antimicrobial extrusion protein DinF [Helianthus annuus]|nr:putative multi antimicrobial extrusion protein DinF [Helianthus annuus]
MAMEGISTSTLAERNFPILVFFKDYRIALKLDTLGREILSIAIPITMALAADPIASLIDTIYIGRIGPVEIAAVGISVALFNQVSKVAIFPLVSITTSFVAEEETIEKINTKVIEAEEMKSDYVDKVDTKGEALDIVVGNSDNGLKEKGEENESATPEAGTPLQFIMI